MKQSRRNFTKRSTIAATGSYLGAVGMTVKRYVRIIGSNDRVKGSVLGFSDRFRDTLFLSCLNHYKELKFDIIVVSDLWNVHRAEGSLHIQRTIGHQVKTCRNNNELYGSKGLDTVVISAADFQYAIYAIEAVKVYTWKDRRQNWDTTVAVFDYGKE